MMTETVLARYWLVWRPAWRAFATPKSSTVLNAPTMPNLVSSWTRCRQRRYMLIVRSEILDPNRKLLKRDGRYSLAHSPGLGPAIWSRYGIGR
jgi:hypothetical protein